VFDLWYKQDVFYDFFLNSPCSVYAEQVLNSQVVRHFYDQTFVKPAGCHLATPWHHDITFWPVDLKKNNICSIWITLDQVTRETSGLEFIKGSHLWDSYWKSYAPGSDALVNKSHKDLPDIDSLRSSHEFFSPEMQPGDSLIFNAHIVHGSSSNLSLDKPRRAFTSRWCDDQTVFEDRIKTKPITASHNLKNGDFLSGPLFPQVRPNVIESELSLRNRGPIKLSKSKFLKDGIFKDLAGFFSFKNLINLR
jgi:ectoine hydroxylase-related dioxygenase (phytanoyl-CoA dioxygenase family)